MELPGKMRWCLLLLGVAGVSAMGARSVGTAAQEIQVTQSVPSEQQSHEEDASDSALFKPYPTGFYVGLTGSAFYRNMYSDSAWGNSYPGAKKYSNKIWGPAANLELGYQISHHWGVAVQAGWVGAQKVTAQSSGSSYSVGDYKRLTTCWAAVLLRMRLKMDYKYYFIAEFGPTYVAQSLRSNTSSTISTSHDNRVLPTAVVGIQYRATENLNVGLQYQLIWGQQNWRDTWAGTKTRYPAIQMLGIKLSYQFNS
jgi:opacity protein-like surface antigen